MIHTNIERSISVAAPTDALRSRATHAHDSKGPGRRPATRRGGTDDEGSLRTQPTPPQRCRTVTGHIVACFVGVGRRCESAGALVMGRLRAVATLCMMKNAEPGRPHGGLVLRRTPDAT